MRMKLMAWQTMLLADVLDAVHTALAMYIICSALSYAVSGKPSPDIGTNLRQGVMAFPMTDGQFQLVSFFLLFTLASMVASTIFFWMKVPKIAGKYQPALLIAGLVTFIAAYTYIRIFNSWKGAYEYKISPCHGEECPSVATAVPQLTGVPFNDAYRYLDWLLTVPMILIEIVLTMKLDLPEARSTCIKLGVSSALMIILGYPGESIIQADQLHMRWVFWALAMIPFLFVVQTMLIGLKAATKSETKESVRTLISNAQRVTVISWLTYPVVYIFPMIGFSGASAVVAIQVGYGVSDVISKCGVGFIIYAIASAKTAQDEEELLQLPKYNK